MYNLLDTVTISAGFALLAIVKAVGLIGLCFILALVLLACACALTWS